MEQCCQSPQYRATQIESSHKGIDKSEVDSPGATETENNSGGFDCNICLDLVQDPVVTLCGHLYCWPCIYRWIHSQKTTPEDPELLPKCPVCKTEVLQNALIPLYGRGQSSKPSNSDASQLGLVIPHRPNRTSGVHTLVDSPSASPHSHHTHQLDYRGRHLDHADGHLDYSLGGHSRSPAFGFAGTTTFYPVIGLFSEMIDARLSRNPETDLYTYPNTYGVASIGSARHRRQVMQAERSLSRVSFFLFCCIILCVLLF